MIWIKKVHYAGSESTQMTADEHPDNWNALRVAKEAIEGYGMGDLDHVEVVPVPDSSLRDWISFDVKVVLENQDGT